MLEGIGKIESKVLDHHGLVMATCEEVELAQQIDRRLGKTKRILSFGKACVAMVLNGLGFTNRRLYLTPQFFANKAVENLLGAGIKAEHINDDALGDTLDAIAAYGPSKLYAEVAHEIALKKDLLHGPIHVDTTSFSVTGEYAIDGEPPASEQAHGAQVIKLTHGFSKDHRPDLKQAVLSLAMVQDSEIPLWMTACNGNASDKKTLQETIETVQAFRRSLKMDAAAPWIADSSLYTAENLIKMKDTVWVSRVPETLAEAKALVGTPDQAITWTIGENGYKTAAFHSHYAGIGQRWLLVFSEQAYRREEKTLYKNVEKQAQSLQQTLWHLGHEMFQCESDAQKAFEKQQQKAGVLFTLTARIVPVEKYAGRGRPQEGRKRQCIGYKIDTTMARNEEAIAQRLATKGRFILATNDLDKARYPDTQILKDYKAQQTVERGFRFLKNPEFIADTLFLKSPKRIMALMMVMTLCLMIYNMAQYSLRKKLQTTQDTLPNQVGKLIPTPTLRWIFQLMEGIAVVKIADQLNTCWQTAVTNLDKLRQKIVHLFGPQACRIYQISEFL
jgi:transposase